MSETTVTGGCKCGAIRFESDRTPDEVVLCHCESCRKITGQPAVALAIFQRASFRFTTRVPKAYESSPGVIRAFCPDCGTPMTWEGQGTDRRHRLDVYVGLFDDPNSFPPTGHVYYAERVSWFDSADSLPRFAGNDRSSTPVSFGPADGLPSTERA